MEIKFRGLAIDENKWVYGYGICVVPNTNIASIIHKQGINLMHLTAVRPETVEIQTDNGLFKNINEVSIK